MSDKPDQGVEAFVFVLQENLLPYLHNKVIGYVSKTEKDPPCPGIFFMGVSQKRVVFGPFIMQGNLFEDSTNLGFSRLYEVDSGYGVFRLEKTLCPWRIRFRPDPPDLKIEYGLKWSKVAEILGIDPTSWRQPGLRKVLLTREQIGRLAQILRDLNTGKTLAEARSTLEVQS